MDPCEESSGLTDVHFRQVVDAAPNAMVMVGRAGRIVLVKARADDSIVHAVDGAARMLALIEDLLTYSRVGRSADTWQPTYCGQILGHALRSLSVVIEESAAHISSWKTGVRT